MRNDKQNSYKPSKINKNNVKMVKEIQRRHGGRFPTFVFLLLVVAVLWLLIELEVIVTKIPWIPIIVIVILLGWMINRIARR